MSSPDTSSLHFPTTDGLLFELVSIHPTKWLNHGQPRGGDVAAVVNVGTLRPGAVFTVSSKGDLYEYDPKAKPAWRKHIREGSSIESFPLEAATGVTLHDLAGPSSTSLFLMTKDGFLVERRLAQSKWRWLFHSSLENVRLTSIGPSFIDPNTGNTSVFCTTRNGTVYEYRLPYALGNAKYGSNSLESGTWIDYKQPADVPVMSSVVGASLGHGRFFFALEDGRIGELHLPGQGGPGVGPITRIPAGKRQPTSYTWSIFESPETEGGNAEYCNADHGPRNCLEGVKHATYYDESKVVSNGKSSQWKRPSGRGRARKSTYVTSSEAEETSSQSVISGSPSPVNQSLSDLFQFRTLQCNRSLFLVGGDGIVTEKFLDGDTWMWLKHEFATPIQGLVAIYNNSIYAVDSEGSLFILESIDNQLQWLNCTALEGGTTVLSGRPWDGVLGDLRVTTLDDALVFVSQSGQLFEFKVALRTFTWRNCGHPPGTKVAAILDQEVLRHRVVYVAGMDGKLYHFNRVTFLWHANKQPSDILLSTIPGVVLRPNFQTTAGSLFLRAEDGSLVEYHWDNAEGWLWTKHGFPKEGVVLATAPGPSLVGSWIFMVVSDGRVFGRHWDGNKWVWIDCGYPSPDILLQEIGGSSIVPESLIGDSAKQDWKPFPLKENSGFPNFDVYLSFTGECNTMMAPVRPVAYASDTATFLLVDGRLAELKQIDEGTWGWTSIIETPTSSCQSTYWAAPES
ncbi:hypothetical protein O6H91_12G019000 [Diphasiastrum complanatum]|nr:hypothetical protein O6H91_12G019000 [Diphasiastrum complanatum]